MISEFGKIVSRLGNTPLAETCVTGRRNATATLVSHLLSRTCDTTSTTNASFRVAPRDLIGTCCEHVATMCRLLREVPDGRSKPDASMSTFQDRLGRMFDDHHDFVRRRVQRLGLSIDKADDAAAEAFLVAAERLDDIKKGSERAFLFGTALRVAQKLMRTERRWVLQGDMDFRLARSATPEVLASERRAVDVISEVVAAMDFDVRRTFMLFEIEGLTTRQIADASGVPPGTVASRLRRARRVLRLALAPRGSPH
jgi:RNA polymerase sigma-70 factor, ECF subfamily